MNIAITNDHAGYDYKVIIKKHLSELGHVVHDFGAMNTDPVDYPDVICQGAKVVADGSCQVGIVIGGSGNGEAIVANKVHGIDVLFVGMNIRLRCRNVITMQM